MKLETFKITYMGKMQIIVNLFQEMIQTLYLECIGKEILCRQKKQAYLDEKGV